MATSEVPTGAPTFAPSIDFIPDPDATNTPTLSPTLFPTETPTSTPTTSSPSFAGFPTQSPTEPLSSSGRSDYFFGGLYGLAAAVIAAILLFLVERISRRRERKQSILEGDERDASELAMRSSSIREVSPKSPVESL